VQKVYKYNIKSNNNVYRTLALDSITSIYYFFLFLLSLIISNILVIIYSLIYYFNYYLYTLTI